MKQKRILKVYVNFLADIMMSSLIISVFCEDSKNSCCHVSKLDRNLALPTQLLGLATENSLSQDVSFHTQRRDMQFLWNRLRNPLLLPLLLKRGSDIHWMLLLRDKAQSFTAPASAPGQAQVSNTPASAPRQTQAPTASPPAPGQAQAPIAPLQSRSMNHPGDLARSDSRSHSDI